MGIEKYLGVTYRLVESENFDEFLKELGISNVKRKNVGSLVTNVTLTEKDGVYTITTSATTREFSFSFQLGKEFEAETLEGRKMKSTITIDGDKLIQDQRGSPDSTIVHEFTDQQVVATIKVNNVVCTRKYIRVS